jgi:DNA-binding transcriptional LysR family regulator
MELDSTEAIKSAIEANLGVGFVSRWALVKEQQLGSFALIKIANLRVRRQFQFIYPQGPEPDKAAGAFLRFARRRHSRFKTPHPSLKLFR